MSFVLDKISNERKPFGIAMGAALAPQGCCQKHGSEIQEITGCNPRCVVDECCPELPARRTPGSLSDQECTDILLVQAVVRGDLEDTKKALEKGADIDTVAVLTLNMGTPPIHKIAKDETPLMRACALGHSDVVELLVKCKAELQRTDSRGWNAVCYALAAGELDIARCVLDASGSARKCLVTTVRLRRKQILQVREECAGKGAAESLKDELQPHGFLDTKNEESGNTEVFNDQAGECSARSPGTGRVV